MICLLGGYIARLVKHPKTQRPKGFGFVTYDSEIEAQKALKAMNGRVSAVKHTCFAELVLAILFSFFYVFFSCSLFVQIVDGSLIFVEVAKTLGPGEDGNS